MASIGAKRKRRVKTHCPNPLFVQWMEEWRDEAREKGVQSQYAYTKALNSLKKYPLPLSSGQEAKILDHIGEKLATMLDKKLAEHRASEGQSKHSKCGAGSSVTSSLSPPPSSSSRNVSSAKIGGKRKERDTTASSHTAKSPHQTSSDDKGAPKPKKHKNTVREYVPLYRSGPYAVLIALYNAEQASTWRGYLTKAELMSEAQPHCDTSFTIPDDGSYYTAWSSVSQIEKKGLVLRTGHPPKFSLTDAGVSLALRLLQGNVATSKITPIQRDYSSSDQGSSSSRSKRESVRPKSCVLSKTPSPPSKHYVPEESPPSSPHSDLTDTYSIDDCEIIECDDTNATHQHRNIRSESQINIKASVTSPPLRNTHPPPTTHSSMTHQPTSQYSNVIALSDSDDSDIEIVPLAERIAKQAKKSPGSVSTTRPPPLSSNDKEALTPSQMAGLAALKRFKKQKETTIKMSVQPLVFDLTEAEEDSQTQAMETVTQTSKTRFDKGEASTMSINSTNTSSKPATMVDKGSITSSDHTSASSSEAILPSTKSPEDFVHVTPVDKCYSSSGCLHVTADTGSSTKKTTTKELEVDLSSPEFTLKPGQFDVVLCVDNSESSASRNSRVQFRGVLLSELGKNGVHFDVRKLNVGDFTWIAREKVQPKPGCLGLPQSREVVFEYIVERKRMDDLAGSIIDGRFNEQKFRLNQCGMAHPIYLVEEFADSTHLKLPERSLNQAIANTQVISGFFVKRTRDIRESVAYLTIMTRALQHRYASKTIKAYSRNTIIKLNKIDPKTNSNIVHSMPFHQFNEASVKTKALSVYEMFGRHLVQLPGFSVDKAAAVLEKYPTVSHLRDAYQNCLDNNEREKLLCEVRAGPSKRRIGPQLSAVVCSLYWRPN